MNRVWLSTVWLITGSAMLWANTDPGIRVESNDPPFQFLGGITNNLGGVQPTTTSPDIVYGLDNDTGIITSLTFDLFINAGLPTNKILNTFTCDQPSGEEYFRHCQVTYSASTGELKFRFYGVRRADGDELCPALDCEVGEKEGIPPGGSFFVELFGWVPDLTIDDPIDVYSGLPTFTNTFTSTVPEPSTVLFIAMSLLLMTGFLEHRRCRRRSA